jgi:lipoprotein-anchoring transpeptidase ErfK/SrfK
MKRAAHTSLTHGRRWLLAAAMTGALLTPSLAVAAAAPANGGVGLAAPVTANGGVGLAAPVTATTVSGSRSSKPTGDSAAAVQKRLVALRYLPAGAVTGRWDYRTSQALVAFQAWQGLQRDGTIGPKTRAALPTASAPLPRTHRNGRVIEIYRALGVTLLVDNGHVVRAVHSSSGKPGYTTPAGSYSVFRKESNSWSHPYGVWLPYASYFNGGIALHSYSVVPAYPASHGCIRIPAPEAAFVYRFAAYHTPIAVY